jgi:hypothetical protein
MRVISSPKEKSLFGIISKPLDFGKIVDQMENHLKTLDGTFAQGHWIGSAYCACVLQKAGQKDRATQLWNKTLTKAQESGFKLVEWEMEALKDGGFYK